jgi:hypothetical protein
MEEFRSTGRVYLLLYAALDVRLCVERTLFEYLVLIKSTDLPRRIERLYSATDLRRAILAEEPQFLRKIEFVNLFVRFLPESKPVVIPNLDLLSQGYGRTNDYLHCPKRPDETWQDSQWWELLTETLSALIQHLVAIHSGFMSYINLSPRGEALFERFVRGELSAAQVTAELAEAFKTSPMRKV